MLCALQAGHYMERAKRGEGAAPGSPELLQSALQQAQRLLTRVWEWLCSLFGYRWQSPQEYQVCTELTWRSTTVLSFCTVQTSACSYRSSGHLSGQLFGLTMRFFNFSL